MIETLWTNPAFWIGLLIGTIVRRSVVDTLLNRLIGKGDKSNGK